MNQQTDDLEQVGTLHGIPPRRPRRGARLDRRAMLATLTGLGAAGLVLVLVGPARSLLGPADRGFPSWVSTMPRGTDAYAAALDHQELLATLPCFCGCMAFEQPHGGLKDCFIQPQTGELDPHGAFCETCQEEALDAVAWSRQGASLDEIHARIVAQYADRDPATGGIGCGGATDEAAAGASCAP